MDVVVTGGTGFIGVPLCKALLRAGHDVTVITRSVDKAKRRLPEKCRVEEWDGHSRGPWEACVAGAQVIINLAGENIAAARWSAKQRKEIIESRLNATRAITRAVAQRGNGHRPPLLINASGKDIYGDRGDMLLDEEAPIGEGFLAQTCSVWEEAAREAQEHGAAVAILRIGLVLARGGALDRMALPYRFFVGGPVGSGRQWVSWIHRSDLIRLILFLIDLHKAQTISSATFNAVAPGAVTMREFSRTLGRVMQRPSWAVVPGPLLRLALGDMADLMLLSQRLQPKRALELGFSFQFPNLESALQDVLRPTGG